jgi:hypothetical protein
MTASEIEKFRTEFQSIVYFKGMVKEAANNISRLEAWNKGGSHDDAILKAIDRLKEIRIKLNSRLYGKSYKDWATFSKRLTVLKSKIKSSRQETTKAKWQSEIDRMKWDFAIEI